MSRRWASSRYENFRIGKERVMPQFLIERHFGKVTPEQLDEGGSTSKRVAAEQFPKIVWEHSHAVETPEGLVTGGLS